MSAPFDAVELRRVVWRHEHGFLDFDRARRGGAEDAYRGVLDAFEGLRGDLAPVRENAPGLLAAWEQARARAERALFVDANLRAAVDHLLRCRDLLARIHALRDAHLALRRASEAVQRLWTVTRSPRLRALPCVEAPARLLAAAQQRMGEGAFVRAAYLARAALGQAAPLAPPARPAPRRAEAVRQRFREMRELCAATRALLADDTGDLGADGTLDAAEALAQGGELPLAERVAEELGALLAERARFHRALAAEGAAAPARLAEIRAALGPATGAEPWAAAARHLWRSRVDEGVRRIHGEHARLGEIGDAESIEYPGSIDLHFDSRDLR